MENNEISNEQHENKGCLNCGNPLIVQGYRNPLCHECRTSFINFPIPKGIKIFRIIILAILIFSVTKMEKNISAGIHLKRGERAEKKGLYLTAQREYEKTIELIPDFQEVNCDLMIASLHNLDFATVFKMSEYLDGKSIENHSLYNEITDVLNVAVSYFPTDSFNLIIEKYKSLDSIPDKIFQSYILKYPEELFPKIRYVSILMDRAEYKESEPLLDFVLSQNKNHITALGMKSAIKRELGQYDSAHYYCDRMIAYNKESTFGISSKARTFLKEKKDEEGLYWAKKSIDIDKNDPYTLATLAVAYHFNNRIEERNKLLNLAKKDSSVMIYMEYAQDVISGKEKFRD